MDNIITWITAERNNGTAWDEIYLARQKSEEALEFFLDFNAKMNHWPHLSVDEWRDIVDSERRKSEARDILIDEKGATVIRGTNENNDIVIPQEEESAWQTYKRHLLKEGFGETAVNIIEDATVKTLRCLSRDTREIGPIKGMVVGNVQSGKTANMAALMAMAADYGWNMFIVLTGMMENLRLQTQARLISDLRGSKWNWEPISNPRAVEEAGKKLRDKRLTSDSKNRYISLCLKQRNRLDNLISWLFADQNSRGNIRMLIIDDECDQASINTSTDTNSRTEINKRILRLINNLSHKGRQARVPFQAVNYIGYTATPYANVLNERPGEESLYPKDFITALSVSDRYLGPQQIFGYEDEDSSDKSFPGMDIVREISTEEEETIREIEDGGETILPETLTHAICWFICGVACMRFKGYRKPLSMLRHTSYKVTPHKNTAKQITRWFEETPMSRIMELCEERWEEETRRFNKEIFYRAYPGYGMSDTQENIDNYPEFNDIRSYITDLVSSGLTNILLNAEDQTRTYNTGIHLCIDNSEKNENPSVNKRLMYPTQEELPDLAPAFLVIGGNTLSRGLTLEGLISTYFLRSAGSADTLMQMGRWFGYRRGYELLPRIWMPEDIKHKYEFISEVDQKLRDEIRLMAMAGISPEDYGPKVMASPSSKWLQIVAKNKQQSAVGAEYDFGGHTIETSVFDNTEKILVDNMEKTRNLLKALGEPVHAINNPYADRNKLWRDVSWDVIKAFLETYTYSSRQRGLNELVPFIKWMEIIQREQVLGNWNVILAGVKGADNDADWEIISGISINKVSRTRRYVTKENSVINIGTLRSFNDFLSDIDAEENNIEAVKTIQGIKHNMTSLNEFRTQRGMGQIPQLVIYIIDKDSMPKDGATTRFPLNAMSDIAGFSINIPGFQKGRSSIRSIHIDIQNDNFVESE